jgi:hypothetical protein
MQMRLLIILSHQLRAKSKLDFDFDYVSTPRRLLTAYPYHQNEDTSRDIAPAVMIIIAL